MKNILALIQRFYLFLLFLGLQILALSLLFRNNNYHQTEFIHHSSDLIGGIYANRARLSEYLRLGEINDQLSLENAQLRSLAPENYIQLRTDLDSIQDTVFLQRFYYRTAKVVNTTVNRQKNYLTIDRGWSGGIGNDMAVIAGGNIVGVIVSTSEHFAVVMPVIHSDFTASVSLKKSGVYGALVWSGGDAAIAEVIKIPKKTLVDIGDSIITSGASKIYPANLNVGVVEEIDDSDNDYHLLKVRLGADFRKLDHVLIVSDVFKTEQEDLLKKVEDADAANGNH